jgi:hypothetical protein
MGPLSPIRVAPDQDPCRQFELGASSLDDYLLVNRHFGAIETPEIEAGSFFPRIWRGPVHLSPEFYQLLPPVTESLHFESFVSSLEHLESLCESLGEVFRVAHPDTGNLGVYGGAIRDLLILACTEVEAQWKGILTTNGYNSPRRFWTTEDYVKLLPVLRLQEYKLCLLRYPGLAAICPFGSWSSAQPSQTIPWYEAYNKTKHNRETNWREATLENAINSVASCVILLAAQFGPASLVQYKFANPFRFVSTPSWEPHLWYFDRVRGRLWTVCPYSVP